MTRAAEDKKRPAARKSKPNVVAFREDSGVGVVAPAGTPPDALDDDVYEELLERSVREHAELWKKLAEV